MRSRVIPLALALLVAIGLAATVLSAQAGTNVTIDYMMIDGTTLTITGNNFGSAPAVFVDAGDGTLAISANSSTEIIAATPPLGKGIHLIKVVRDSGDGGSAVSTLQIK